MSEITSEKLANYFAIREEQRQHDITQTLPQLEEQMTAFLDEHAADPSLPVFLARLIREAAVAAGVNGAWNAGGSKGDILPDSIVLHDAVRTLRSHSDLYPAWRAFDGRSDEEEDDA